MAPKSNALYIAYESAKQDAVITKGAEVPLHLRNATTSLMESLNYGKGYQYAHDCDAMLTNMECLPEKLRGKSYYHPKESGGERIVIERLDGIKRYKEFQKKIPQHHIIKIIRNL